MSWLSWLFIVVSFQVITNRFINSRTQVITDATFLNSAQLPDKEFKFIAPSVQRFSRYARAATPTMWPRRSGACGSYGSRDRLGIRFAFNYP